MVEAQERARNAGKHVREIPASHRRRTIAVSRIFVRSLCAGIRKGFGRSEWVLQRIDGVRHCDPVSLPL